MGLLKAADNVELWFEVPTLPGFDILVKYLTPTDLKRLGDRATSKKLNRSTRVMEETVDNDLLAKLMIREMIRDWRGLKVKHLEKMMPLDADSRKAIEKEGELPFSEDDLETLAEYSYSRSFLDSVMDIATDMTMWCEAEEATASKN